MEEESKPKLVLEEYDPNFDAVVDQISPIIDNTQLTYFLGLEVTELKERKKMKDILKLTQILGVDFLITPFFDHKLNTEVHERSRFSDSDLVLRSSDWNRHILPHFLEEMFSGLTDPETRDACERCFYEEYKFAHHLGVPAIILPEPTWENVDDFARLLVGISHRDYYKIPCWVRFSVSKSRSDNSYLLWTRLRMMSGYNDRIACVLSVCGDCDSVDNLDRWMGAPVSGFELALSAFDSKWVFKKAAFELGKHFFHRKPQIWVKGGDDLDKLDIGKITREVERVVNWGERTQVDKFVSAFNDEIQVPLQPLAKNLTNRTYEVFEVDPVKYAKYEEAVGLALSDVCEEVETIVVMVLGAGRGPLVKAVYRAVKKKKIKRAVRVHVVEKNANAVVTLKCLKNEIWRNVDLHVHHADIRSWKPPEKADILVSELLGSFGDNELAPECLDNAKSFLRSGSRSICIPNSSCSYLRPVASHNIHMKYKTLVKASGKKEYREIASVVKLTQCYYFGTQPKPCFTFFYPHDPRSKNRRKVLAFKARKTSLLTGFAGYFTTKLYKHVELSILPDEHHTQNLVSWFPIYFPLVDPLFVKKGDVVKIKMWRLNDSKKVWYEWCAETSPGVSSKIHNVGGCSYLIKL